MWGQTGIGRCWDTDAYLKGCCSHGMSGISSGAPRCAEAHLHQLRFSPLFLVSLNHARSRTSLCSCPGPMQLPWPYAVALGLCSHGLGARSPTLNPHTLPWKDKHRRGEDNLVTHLDQISAARVAKEMPTGEHHTCRRAHAIRAHRALSGRNQGVQSPFSICKRFFGWGGSLCQKFV